MKYQLLLAALCAATTTLALPLHVQNAQSDLEKRNPPVVAPPRGSVQGRWPPAGVQTSPQGGTPPKEGPSQARTQGSSKKPSEAGSSSSQKKGSGAAAAPPPPKVPAGNNNPAPAKPQPPKQPAAAAAGADKPLSPKIDMVQALAGNKLFKQKQQTNDQDTAQHAPAGNANNNKPAVNSPANSPVKSPATQKKAASGQPVDMVQALAGNKLFKQKQQANDQDTAQVAPAGNANNNKPAVNSPANSPATQKKAASGQPVDMVQALAGNKLFKQKQQANDQDTAQVAPAGNANNNKPVVNLPANSPATQKKAASEKPTVDMVQALAGNKLFKQKQQANDQDTTQGASAGNANINKPAVNSPANSPANQKKTPPPPAKIDMVQALAGNKLFNKKQDEVNA